MTAKSTVRKTAARKSKGPSQAELKRQASQQKARADQAEAKADEALKANAETQELLKTLMAKIDEQGKTQSARDVIGNHDQSQMAVSQVLREQAVEDIPPKPVDDLPAHLQKVKRALDNPVTKSGIMDSREVEVGQFNERPMNSEGDAKDSVPPLTMVDQGILEVNGKKWSRDKLEMEAFMHEYVYVQVHEASDPAENPLPEVVVNGVLQLFLRGKPQWVRRKFVERLARAKKTLYSQKEIRDENGNRKIVMLPNNVPVYPFHVIQDTPKGKQWLRDILAEPV